MYHTQLLAKEPHSYKFSRELLLMRKSVESLAKQSRFEEAHKLKLKADQARRGADPNVAGRP